MILSYQHVTPYAERLHAKIDALVLSVQCVGTTTRGGAIDIEFDGVLDAQQIASVDAVVPNHHIESLADAKAAKRVEVVTATGAFVYARYPQHRQTNLSTLLTYALAEQKMNRFAHITGGVMWIEAVRTYCNTVEAQIGAATTVAAVDAIVYDLQQFVVSDPCVTVDTALAITT